MFTPAIVAIDYETSLTDGTPSVDYFREDFRVVSAALAWRGTDGSIKSRCLEGEDEVLAQLERLKQDKVPVVVHNFQFEYGVTQARFPGYEQLVMVDTMRLAQVGDNGGKQAAWQPKIETYDSLLDSIDGGVKSTATGLSLSAAVSRWLPEELHNHKAPYHAWLREHAGAKKGQEGQHLTKLPPDMFTAYNVADAEVTLRLYEALVTEFAGIGYDWRMDHELYKSTACMVASAKGGGVRVDTAALTQYLGEVQQEIAQIEHKFRVHFGAQLNVIEAERYVAYTDAPKTERGKAKRREKAAADSSDLRFNIGSNKQLQRLFVDVLGVKPKFWTKAPKDNPNKPRKKEFVPAPSFKAAHLSTYGEGGEMLIKRRKRLLVFQQVKALLALAQYDGRWHADVRAAGTATGRLAGGRTE